MEKTSDFNKYKHAYATWAAARAVQRAFTKTEIISKAINESRLREFAEDSKIYTQDDFDNFHKECAHKLINSFKKHNIEDVKYGRAAKIIAIYLKTSVIICSSGKCDKSKIIHPPIDSIVLKLIAKKHPDLESLKNETWTSFDENQYQNLVKKCRDYRINFDWTLEKDWNAIGV